MAIDDVFTTLNFFLRWFHILAGITWIGLLYFFNFVNVPFQGVLDKEYKAKVNPQLLFRALWWFRWAAMVTFVVGWLLLLYKYGHTGMWTDAEGRMTEKFIWMLFGSTLGSIMWFNVWFIIWPCQKKILTFLKQGQSPPEVPVLAKRALLASRTNAYLSGPMLFGMIAPTHYAAINLVTFVVVCVLATVVMWALINQSKKLAY